MPNIPGPDTCPTDIDETAEAYLMATLSRASARNFEDHFITCSGCAAAVEEAERYVHAMKVAVRRLGAANPR